MSTRTGVHLLILVLFLLPTSAIATQHEQPEPVSSLGAVWILSTQPCNGGVGNAMERHPQEDAIRTSKTIDLPSLGLTFSVPQLFDVERAVVKLFMGDTARGVVDNYLLISVADLEPPFAAVVITELPKQMQNQEQAFQAVSILQNQLAAAAGVKPDLKRIDGPFGAALEMVVRDRVGSHCFPTSDFQLAPNGHEVSTCGISRFTLINGHLIEFALVSVIPPDTPDGDAVAFVREAMDDFWVSLRPIQE